MQRNKNIAYDEDELYSEEEDDYQGQEGGYTQEDRDNFARLTPVVRAELDEAGIPTTTTQIEESLWHYYWDVGKAVAYLKNQNAPKQPQLQQQQARKDKPKSKFDEAQQRSAEKAGREPLLPISGADWFKDTPWIGVPEPMMAHLVSSQPTRPKIQLLGGSSKLAKLAEERRRKAASSQAPQSAPAESINSLDRLSKPKITKENEPPTSKPELKKYPIRRKRSPTPPPKSPTPPPPSSKEELPDLRTSPTAFGRTLSRGAEQPNPQNRVSLQHVFGAGYSNSPFEGLSPDDTVMRAQDRSKGLNK